MAIEKKIRDLRKLIASPAISEIIVVSRPTPLSPETRDILKADPNESIPIQKTESVFLSEKLIPVSKRPEWSGLLRRQLSEIETFLSGFLSKE